MFTLTTRCTTIASDAVAVITLFTARLLDQSVAAKFSLAVSITAIAILKITVVTLLRRIDDEITAEFNRAGITATIAALEVAVVTLLGRLHDAVATHQVCRL